MSNYRRSLVPGGTFFFTVTLADRRATLLTDAIPSLRRAYSLALQRMPFDTVAICVLPDHLHAIWTLPPGDADFSRRWSLIKSQFSMTLSPSPRSASKANRREKGIWQRRFWEHQIRDQVDLERHVDYIHHNPVRHGLVTQVKDWPYSSFHRYVKDGLLPEDWAGDGEDAGGFGE
ncbi:REP-associated tyrosine transposase [Pseudomonas tohonis]|jgi:putative transposase|uniref:REP-associated tyrosine transposase n=1 Tax=Pseudomonas tohonis TaxID=2725477 RepID=UPI001F26F511|nr:transposase [Pseudomonas tohonis]